MTVCRTLLSAPRDAVKLLSLAGQPAGWDGSSDTGEALATWRKAAAAANLKERKHVVAADRIEVAVDAQGAKVMQPAAHGGFDNDVAVITRTLERITKGTLAVGVDDLRGY